MGPRYRLGRWLHSRSRTLLPLVLVVAAIGAVVLATAAGAHRTSTAPDRYTAAHGFTPEASVFQSSGEPASEEVARLAGVEHVDAMSFMYAGLFLPGGDASVESLLFTGSFRATSANLVAGREPDATNPYEMVLWRPAAAAAGVSLGDSLHVRSMTDADAKRFGFDGDHLDGPQFDVVVVGLIDGAADLEDGSAIGVLSPALLQHEPVGVAATVMAVDLATGVSLDDFRAEVSALPRAGEFRVDDALIISDEVRTAVQGQALGLWILAALGALAAVAALGYLMVRNARLDDGEVLSLSAIGYTRAQIVLESAWRAAVATTAGMVLAVVIATMGSSMFPFGFVDRIEPDPGARFDPLLLLPGALVLVVAVVAWVAVASRPGAARRARRPSLMEPVAERCPWPAMATGLRFAFTPSSDERGSLAAPLAGLAVVVAAVVGSLTFALSVRRLVQQPARFGADYDLMLDNGAEQVEPELLALVVAQPDVSDVGTYRVVQGRVAGGSLAITGFASAKGEVHPVMLAGREPVAGDELAIGRVSARRLGLSVGDTVQVSTDAATAQFVITGLVVPIGIGGNDLVGQGAMVTAAGIDRLDPGGAPQAATAKMAPGVPRSTAAELAAAAGFDPSEGGGAVPPRILNLRRVTFVPFVLAALLGVLAGVVVVGGFVAAARRSGRQVAVLRALGADARWLRAAAWWQAVAAMTLTASIGSVVGLVVGRLVFRMFGDDLGVVSDPATPLLLGGGAVVALAVVAVTTVLVAGHRTRRDRPAVALRSG